MAVQRTAAVPDTVHVVFSNHLDLGFGFDGNAPVKPVPATDDNVINAYFDVYFPRAIQVAEELRKAGKPERYIYMTHSYLVSLFLDCPPAMGLHCPNASAVADFEAAVRRGDITWHAFPHNAQLEVMDAPLVEFGCQLTHELDARFGLAPKAVLSQRDIPGLTRAALPVLAGQGVRALSLGVNGGSAPPAVPHNRPFIWRDAASGTDMLAVWHPGGYSGWPVDSKEECVRGAPGHILCTAWRGDNAGPHTVPEVLEIFRLVQASFPGAHVQASTLEAWVEPLLEHVAKLDLPVVTQEIGDTWIHGVATDVDKLSEFRALLRLRNAAIYRWQDPDMRNFSRILLKVPEHTWGLDVKSALPDYVNWSNADLHAQLAAHSAPHALITHSWVRQRAWLRWALEALGDSADGLRGWREFGELQDLKIRPGPEAAGFRRLDLAAPGATTVASHAWQVELDPATGALAGLRRLWPAQQRPSGSTASAAAASAAAAAAPAVAGGQWASRQAPLGQLVYSTYAEADYDVIWHQYSYFPMPVEDWFYKDFGKPNCTLGGARRSDSRTSLKEVWLKQQGTGFQLLVKAALPAWTVAEAGGMAEVWYDIRSLPGSDDLQYDLLWLNKTATRLPEAVWLAWTPAAGAAQAASWRLHKLGRPVSPLDVVRNGSQAMHAVGDQGVAVCGAGDAAGERLQIWTLDAALVSPGAATPFPQIRQPPDMTQGVSFCLANNIWGTNYVMWQPYLPDGASQRFRFVLQMTRGACQQDVCPVTATTEGLCHPEEHTQAAATA